MRATPVLAGLLIAACGSDGPNAVTTSTPPAQPQTAQTPTAPRQRSGTLKRRPQTPRPRPRFTAAQVAAFAGWTPYEYQGSGSDSTDGDSWTGWINRDGCYIKELLLTRSAVNKQLPGAPRRTSALSRRSSAPWTATNAAGDIGIVGWGRPGQGAKRWHGFDCHASLGADLSNVP